MLSCSQGLASLAADPKDPVTANKVSLLISEVLDLANRVLPPNHAVRVQVRMSSLASPGRPADFRSLCRPCRSSSP